MEPSSLSLFFVFIEFFDNQFNVSMDKLISYTFKRLVTK